MNESTAGERVSPVSTDIARERESSYRWVILGSLWCLYFAFGLVSRSLAPLVTPIIADLNMSYSQMGLVLGAYQLTYIAVAAVGGGIIDRWGVRKALFAGTLVMGLSALLRFFPHQFLTMLLVVALFGVGGPMISIGCPKAISTWFSGKSRATGVGIYMTAPWLGGILVLSLTNSLVMPLAGNSWRLTFVYYSVIVFAAAVLWLFLARDKKPSAASGGAGITEVFANLLRLRKVQVILVMGLLSFGISHGLSNWLPRILETNGLSPSLAGYAASIPMAVGIPAILIIPRTTPPHLRGRIIAVFAAVAAAATMAIVMASGALFFAGLILFGATASSFMPLLILVMMDSPEIEAKYMGSAGGLYFCVAEIGGFGGPLAIGALVDITGTFLAGAVFIAAMLLAMLLMALRLTALTRRAPQIAS